MEKLDTTLYSGQRLDIALANHPKILSRQRAKKIIKQNFITINTTKKIRPSLKVSIEQEIFFKIPPEKTTNLEKIAKPIKIYYEDENLLVVFKPAGLIVHPADSYEGESLLHYLLAHTTLATIGAPQRDGIVHRIDKNTSGLLVIAKNNTTHLSLAQQFQNHSVYRKYLCFVCGAVDKTAGKIEKNICRHPKKRQIFTTHQTLGKNAITYWKSLQQWNFVKLLECQLKTGRTHQIRVHLTSEQMPIIGDNNYGNISKKSLPNLSEKIQNKILTFPRQALHAKELGFWHPQKKKKIHFDCALPQDMQELLDALNTQ